MKSLQQVLKFSIKLLLSSSLLSLRFRTQDKRLYRIVYIYFIFLPHCMSDIIQRE